MYRFYCFVCVPSSVCVTLFVCVGLVITMHDSSSDSCPAFLWFEEGKRGGEEAKQGDIYRQSW